MKYCSTITKPAIRRHPVLKLKPTLKLDLLTCNVSQTDTQKHKTCNVYKVGVLYVGVIPKENFQLHRAITKTLLTINF